MCPTEKYRSTFWSHGEYMYILKPSTSGNIEENPTPNCTNTDGRVFTKHTHNTSVYIERFDAESQESIAEITAVE